MDRRTPGPRIERLDDESDASSKRPEPGKGANVKRSVPRPRYKPQIEETLGPEAASVLQTQWLIATLERRVRELSERLDRLEQICARLADDVARLEYERIHARAGTDIDDELRDEFAESRTYQ